MSGETLDPVTLQNLFPVGSTAITLAFTGAELVSSALHPWDYGGTPPGILASPRASSTTDQPFLGRVGQRAPTGLPSGRTQVHRMDFPGIRAHALGRGPLEIYPAPLLWVDADAGKRTLVTLTRTLVTTTQWPAPHSQFRGRQKRRGRNKAEA